MSRASLVVSIAAAALGGCNSDPGTAPSLARTQVPFFETYHGTGTFGTAAGCDAPGFAHVTATGEGRASHLGRYTIAHSHCVNLGTGEFFDGVFVKTAANGDSLFGTYDGTASVVQAPEPIGVFAIEGDLALTGGTGRFAGASGAQRMSGTQTTDFSQAGSPTVLDLTIQGTISTVGSTR